MKSRVWRRPGTDAVSPVIGVMLMIVVVVIIAAVVSAFAGGIAGSQKSPKSTGVEAKFSVTDGLFLTNTGSNSINLETCRVFLTAEGKKHEVPSGSFWITDGLTIRPVQIIMSHQTVRWGGNRVVWTLSNDDTPITPQPRTDLIGTTGKVEIFNGEGTLIATADFVIGA